MMIRTIALVATLLVAPFVFAAEQPPFTFAPSVTEANGQLDTTLTWDAVGAASCVASGHPSWEGERPANGSQQLPPITLSGTYQLMLVCHWPGDTSARLSWAAPTENTDGTPYVNAKGFTVHTARSADGLADTVGFFVPHSQDAYILEELEEGDHYFCVKAVNDADVASACSDVVSKTIVESETVERSIALTINPIPKAPTELAAE